MIDQYSVIGGYPWVRETPFRQVYLPILLNISSVEERDRWLSEVAGNLFTRVNVVADDDENNVLFWIPPMKYTPATAPGGNLMEIAQHFERVKDMYGDKPADRYYTQTLVGTFLQPDPPQEDIDQWKMILERYGYTQLLEEKGEGKKDDDSGLISEEEDWC